MIGSGDINAGYGDGKWVMLMTQRSVVKNGEGGAHSRGRRGRAYQELEVVQRGITVI